MQKLISAGWFLSGFNAFAAIDSFEEGKLSLGAMSAIASVIGGVIAYRCSKVNP